MNYIFKSKKRRRKCTACVGCAGGPADTDGLLVFTFCVHLDRPVGVALNLINTTGNEYIAIGADTDTKENDCQNKRDPFNSIIWKNKIKKQ